MEQGAQTEDDLTQEINYKAVKGVEWQRKKEQGRRNKGKKRMLLSPLDWSPCPSTPAVRLPKAVLAPQSGNIRACTTDHAA